MIPLVALLVSPHTMLALLQYMQDMNADLSPADIADEAVMAWLDARRDEAARAARPVLRGYQRKCLFLPEGTRLRIWCRSEHGHAEVVGDRLMYKGRSVSPNGFVAACSDTVRNAWVEISVLMPGETAWKLASVRRREIQAAARLAQSNRDALAIQPAVSSAVSSAASSGVSSAASSTPSPALQPPSPPAPPSGLPANTRFAPIANARAGAPAQPRPAPYDAACLQPEDDFAYPIPQEQYGSRRQCPDRRDPRAPLDRRDNY